MSGLIMQAGVGSCLTSGSPTLSSKHVCGLKAVAGLHARKRKDDYRNVAVFPPFPKEPGEWDAAGAGQKLRPCRANQQTGPLPPSRCDSLAGSVAGQLYVNSDLDQSPCCTNQAPLLPSRFDSLAGVQLYLNSDSDGPGVACALSETARVPKPGYSNCQSRGSYFETHVDAGPGKVDASTCTEPLPMAFGVPSKAVHRVSDVQVHHHFHHHIHRLVDQRLTDHGASRAPPLSGPEAFPLTSSSQKFTPPPDVFFPTSRGPSARREVPREQKLDYHKISRVLDDNRRELQCSGWFHEKLGAGESEELLKGAAPGTFLVRYSSDPRCLFSLTVQQGQTGGGRGGDCEGDDGGHKAMGQIREGKGPTSSRIHFQNGKFHMDATDEKILKYMPQFDSVVELVEHYVKCTSSKDGKDRNVWVDNDGNIYRIFLSRPLCRQPSDGGSRSPPSLFHLSRLAVHKSIGEWRSVSSFGSKTPTPRRLQNLDAISKLNLPTGIKDYLTEYPRTI